MTPELPRQLHVESPASESGRDYAERQLQNYLIENLSELGIFNARLVASEYQTEVGRIDLLVSSGSDTLWVVELKAGVAGRDAIGQITSYIGAIRDSNPSKAVLGLLAATDFDKACLSAHGAIGDVELKRVRIEYVLEKAAPLNIHKGKITTAPQAPFVSEISNGIAACQRCGIERSVSPTSQGFHCASCSAFNQIFR